MAGHTRLDVHRFDDEKDQSWAAAPPAAPGFFHTNSILDASDNRMSAVQRLFEQARERFIVFRQGSKERDSSSSPERSSPVRLRCAQHLAAMARDPSFCSG